MRSGRLASFVAMATALVTLAAGCGNGSSTTTTKQVAGGTVIERLGGDYTSFDYLNSVLNTPGTLIITAFYDRLVSYDEKGNLTGYVAKSWKTTATTATFTVRNDVKCADGTLLKPGDIAASVKAVLAAAPLTGTSRLFGGGPFTVTSDDSAATVTVTSSAPFTNLVSGFADPYASIVCPAGLADPKAMASKTFGSGPFTLTSATHGDSVVGQVRKEWKWGPGGVTSDTSGFPQKLVLKVVDNDTTAANLLTTSGLDVSDINGPDVTRLIANKSLVHKQSHSYSTYPMIFQQMAGHPLVDKALRQAVSMAVDPAAWNQAAYSGYGTLSSSWITADGQCYDPETKNLAPKYDLNKAKTVLQQAGYSTGSDGKLKDKKGNPVTLKIMGFPNVASGPEYVLNQLQKLGINAQLNRLDFATFAQKIRGGDWDITWLYIPNEYPLMSANIVFLTGKLVSQGGQNRATIQDPEIDAAVRTAMTAQPANQCKAWATVQELVLKGYYLVPLSAPVTNWFGRSIDFQPHSPRTYPVSLHRIS
jgi:peptide/nickel transport system substrate-binding protein